MRNIYCGKPGETYFCTSDIGWVVGHSYIVYGPLISGMATILYEGLPTRPDGGIWWSLVEKYKVTVMFSAPTAVRVLKKQDPALMAKYDLSSLRALFLAGEPLDEPTAQWISGALGKPIIDNYWQTETGWPILSIANGVEKAASKFGSPGVAMYGYNVKLIDENTGDELIGANQKGVVAIEGPLPPGCLQTVWRDDARFVNTYWKSIPGKLIYSTFDWAVRDEDGYFFILGRTDDVINVAGHRLGTREIEESISGHPNISEVAVVGVADALKGQVAMAFAVVKDASSADRRRGAPEAGGRGHEAGGHHHRRRGPPGARALCDRAAQNPQRQATAPRHSGRVRRPRPGRFDDHGRPGGAAADSGFGRLARLTDWSTHSYPDTRRLFDKKNNSVIL